MAKFDDLYSESKAGVQFRMGQADSPVDTAILLEHEVKGSNQVRLASASGASFTLVDRDDNPIGSLAGAANGALLSLGSNQRPSIVLNGPDSSVQAGLNDNAPGSLTLFGRGGRAVAADAADGTFVMRGFTGDDALSVDTNAASTQTSGQDSCELRLGGANRFGQLLLRNDSDTTTIRMSGQTGDIEFFNADFAEEFEVTESAVSTAVPGTVMAISQEGTVDVCSEDYSTAAVGVVAGAGDYKPALVLDKQDGPNRRPIAMIGKVGCLADATEAPIRVGDLLTTSTTAGHARAVTDRGRALGAVIGKALSPLDSGTGLIRVLVTLQ